jgi:hypothetical protein
MAFPARSLAVICAAVLCAGSGGAGQRDDRANDARTPAQGEAVAAAATKVLIPVEGAADLPGRVRAANEQLYTDLESFVCNERVLRFKGSLSGEEAHAIDTLTARVSFENGLEHYSDVRQNKQTRSKMSSLAGAWSEGEFGTLLRQTQELLATQPVRLEKESNLDGTAAAIYEFDVSGEESPWDLDVGGEHYRLAFRTEVWVSSASGQILQIERRTTSMTAETGISEVRWSVKLAPTDLSGRTWLLPKSGEYSVLYEESGRREWNLMSFSDYHRYGSEVAVRFDEVK